MSPDVAKCLLVSKVLVADGMMHDEERGFLAHLMERLGLSEAERKDVIDMHGLDHAAGIVSALPVEERQALLEMLVDAASSDGTLSPHELATVKRVTIALGL
ncbi:MAG: TerB family tellurite resistance protein [Deltaproteobacteria bacterium]|nr:TerB family tellurite resistance protein [Deltaproteobacteria bacterium]